MTVKVESIVFFGRGGYLIIGSVDSGHSQRTTPDTRFGMLVNYKNYTNIVQLSKNIFCQITAPLFDPGTNRWFEEIWNERSAGRLFLERKYEYAFKTNGIWCSSILRFERESYGPWVLLLKIILGMGF